MGSFSDRLAVIYRRVSEFLDGFFGLFRTAVRRFGDARAPEAAAGMAYYALFSLFPLLIALIAIGSFVLEREQVYQQAVGFVTGAFPISQELIERNVQRVLDLRGTVGIAGLIGLLWSATGFFTALARNVNCAWPRAESRSFLRRRLVALGMMGTLLGFLLLSLLSTTAINLLPRFQVPLWGGVSVYEMLLWKVLSNLVPWVFSSLMFLSLYRWVPNTEVGWSGPLVGAFLAAFAWEVAASAFAWYLGSGLVQYELIYGSLGTVIALMLWIYIGSLITLFGAHLGAAVEQDVSGDVLDNR